MTTSLKATIVLELISGFFILLFVYTALSKFYDVTRFKNTLEHAPLVAQRAALMAWVIPVLELGIAALLFFPSVRRVGLLSAVVLMAFFTGYIGYMLVFAQHLPCSCGGVITAMTWKQHLFFNGIVLGLGVAGCVLDKRTQASATT